MKLTWSALALSDRDGIFTHIEAHSPKAAIAVDERIADAVRRLTAFPESGRPGRVAGTRELVIPGTPYIAAYEPVAEWPQTAGMERSADGRDVAQPSRPAAGLS